MEDEDDHNERNDGLAESYDLILLGTGLVQSILSCVASKHGKKVLHLERNEFYGEDYSCHHLSTHLSHYSHNDDQLVVKSEHELIEVHNRHSPLCEVPQKEVVVQFMDNVSGSKGLAHSKMQLRSSHYHPACFGYSMEHTEAEKRDAIGSSNLHPAFQGYVTHKQLTKARVWLRDRDFNIDTTAKVLYGSCPLVELMVASGVSNYLEFKSFEGLYFWMDQTGMGAGDNGTVWKVPCSRNDVFNTTMLGALEKRALMKFHQFVADWGRVHSGTEVASLNETDLAVGRSLYRPQNKQQAFAGYNVEAFVDRPFEEFLEDCKISPKLQRIIIFALCCYATPPHTSTGSSSTSSGTAGRERLAPSYLTRQALGDMFLHIDSIGRFGETAFLSPMYGASEVVQAFCRMSAVWGGTFVLRRSVSSVSLEDNAGGTGEGGSAAAVGRRVASVLDSAGNTIRCGAFVCSAGYWPNIPTRRCAVVACTSTWLGAVVPLARSIIILPPSSLSSVRNPYAVHIIQTDASTCAAPEGAVVLHVSTLVDLDADGDSSAPWAEQAQLHGARAVDLIDAIVRSLRESMQGATGAQPAVELSRVVTLKPVYDLSAGADGPTLPSNVRLCTGVSDVSLSMQAACDQARDIFAQLFPDLDFTLQEVAEVSEEAQQMQSAAAVENDDEAAYLEFALKAAMPSPAQEQDDGASQQTTDT